MNSPDQGNRYESCEKVSDSICYASNKGKKGTVYVADVGIGGLNVEYSFEWTESFVRIKFTPFFFPSPFSDYSCSHTGTLVTSERYK
jgi:hypothetical protein